MHKIQFTTRNPTPEVEISGRKVVNRQKKKIKKKGTTHIIVKPIHCSLRSDLNTNGSTVQNVHRLFDNLRRIVPETNKRVCGLKKKKTEKNKPLLKCQNGSRSLLFFFK